MKLVKIRANTGFVVITVAFLLAGCFNDFGSSGSRGLEDADHATFEKSDAAKWIALPTNADEITTFNFFGFDTNYRFLKATLSDNPPELPSLLARSLQIQPRIPDNSLVTISQANISYEEFSSHFVWTSSVAPLWWKTDFSRFDQQSFCAWQSTNNYGYGYLYLYDSNQKELRAFQWSRQWDTVESTLNAL